MIMEEQVNFHPPFDFAATDFLLSSSSSSYQQNCPIKRRRSNLGNQETRVIKKPKFSTKKSDPLAPKITSPCPVCGKKFWSWKALFGHMRCHPERNWRGINPPSSSSSQFSPKQSDPDVEFSDQLCSTITGDQSFTQMTDEEHDVADCLLLLANSPALINDSDNMGGEGRVLVGRVKMAMS